jgi:hypothetical protein
MDRGLRELAPQRRQERLDIDKIADAVGKRDD